MTQVILQVSGAAYLTIVPLSAIAAFGSTPLELGSLYADDL
jgi:hypothetical protein